MSVLKKIMLLLALGVCITLTAQLNLGSKTETKESSYDVNSIKISKTKRRKRVKKVKVSESDLKEATEIKANARYRKKRSGASKKCKKKTLKTNCRNNKAEALLKKKK